MDEQRTDGLTGERYAIAQMQEHYARSHEINRDTLDLADHGDEECPKIHPGFNHQNFESLAVVNRMSMFYAYEVKLAQQALSAGNVDGAIDRCETRLLRWWPYESRAVEVLDQALNIKNRSFDDHFITSIYGASWRYSSRTLRIRRLLDPWLSWSMVGVVALFIPILLYMVETEYENLDPVVLAFFWIFAGLIVAKIALRLAPDPALLHGHWSARTGWGDQHCPWDFQTWRTGQWW